MKTQSSHIRIGEGRRIVLPSEVCESMSLGVGGTIIIRVEDNPATLSCVVRTIERFQALLAEKVPAGYYAVDELIAEREDASQREYYRTGVLSNSGVCFQ